MEELKSLDELLNKINALRRGKAGITFHSIGDRDSVASAFGISELFPNSEIMTPDFITNNAKRMLERLGISEKIKPFSSKGLESVIILDANTLEVMGNAKRELESFEGRILFIDHHARHKEENKGTIFNSEEFNSTSSIIYELLKKAGVLIKKEIAIMLLNGIFADSADFQNSTSLTFMQISELLKTSGISFSEITNEMGESIPVENRYLLFQDICAAEKIMKNGHLFITGISRLHANIVAEACIKFGADAALFMHLGNEEVSLSARLRSPLDKQLSIHLGKIMQKIGQIISGTGGGHSCAAGAYGPAKNEGTNALNAAKGEILSLL
ncbi:MAG: DHH family phosphoesterase [Candidatus Micrarchaeaceae archaeon]